MSLNNDKFDILSIRVKRIPIPASRHGPGWCCCIIAAMLGLGCFTQPASVVSAVRNCTIAPSDSMAAVPGAIKVELATSVVAPRVRWVQKIDGSFQYGEAIDRSFWAYPQPVFAGMVAAPPIAVGADGYAWIQITPPMFTPNAGIDVIASQSRLVITLVPETAIAGHVEGGIGGPVPNVLVVPVSRIGGLLSQMLFDDFGGGLSHACIARADDAMIIDVGVARVASAIPTCATGSDGRYVLRGFGTDVAAVVGIPPNGSGLAVGVSRLTGANGIVPRLRLAMGSTLRVVLTSQRIDTQVLRIEQARADGIVLRYGGHFLESDTMLIEGLVPGPCLMEVAADDGSPVSSREVSLRVGDNRIEI